MRFELERSSVLITTASGTVLILLRLIIEIEIQKFYYCGGRNVTPAST